MATHKMAAALLLLLLATAGAAYAQVRCPACRPGMQRTSSSRCAALTHARIAHASRAAAPAPAAARTSASVLLAAPLC